MVTRPSSQEVATRTEGNSHYGTSLGGPRVYLSTLTDNESPASTCGNSFVVMAEGQDDEVAVPLEIDATVVTDDLTALVDWVTDHLGLDSSFTYINDWVDPDSDEEDPVPEDVIAGDVAVYLLRDPAAMVDLAGRLLPLIVPGIRVESS